MKSIDEEVKEVEALFAEAYDWRDNNREMLACSATEQIARMVKTLDSIFFWYGPSGGLKINVIEALDGLSYDALSGNEMPEEPVFDAATFLERVHAQRVEDHPEYGLYLEDLIAELQKRLKRRKQADQEIIDATISSYEALYGVAA